MLPSSGTATAVYPLLILSVVGIGFALYRWYTWSSSSDPGASSPDDQTEIRPPSSSSTTTITTADANGASNLKDRAIELTPEPELERDIDDDGGSAQRMDVDVSRPTNDSDVEMPHQQQPTHEVESGRDLDEELESIELTNPWRDDPRRNESDDMTVVVIDIGSTSTRAGVCRRSSHDGDDNAAITNNNTITSASRSPLVVLPSVVGFVRSKVGSQHVNTGLAVHTPSNPSRPVFVGKDVFEVLKVQDLAVVHPIAHGRVTDWDALEALIQRALISLHVNAKHATFIMTCDNGEDREQLSQLMFETFAVRQLLIVTQGALELYEHEWWSGVAVHLGGDSSFIMPVYEGSPIAHAVTPFPITGELLSEYLLRSLPWSQSSAVCASQREKLKLVDRIKEVALFVARSGEQQADTTQLNSIVPEDCTQCAEYLFKPTALPGITPTDSMLSLPDAIVSTIIDKCPAELHRHLVSHITLAGGTAAFRGLAKRLRHEIAGSLESRGLSRLAAAADVHLGGVPEPTMTTKLDSGRFSTEAERLGAAPYHGAARLASLYHFPEMLVSDAMYHEHGSRAVTWYCL